MPAPNDFLVAKLSEFLKKGNNEEAIKNIDELIRRNPFKKELYQLRMTVNKKLKRTDLIVNDAQKLQNFIQGVTLDDLTNVYSREVARQDSVLQAHQPIVETMPQFPGGEKKMMEFIRYNLKYPNQAFLNNIQGTVIVNFVIDREGIISRAKVMSSPHPILSAEALRVISLMPDWTPGMQDGKPVTVSYTIPIKFMMD